MSFHLLNKIDKNNIDDEVANLAINEINEGSVSYHKVEEGTK